jgi:hypothetical protein
VEELEDEGPEKEEPDDKAEPLGIFWPRRMTGSAPIANIVVSVPGGMVVGVHSGHKTKVPSVLVFTQVVSKLPELNVMPLITSS